ncbi:MAG: hypothetical protein ACYDDA_15730 [Acidiferrobacteraceae bacterium]
MRFTLEIELGNDAMRTGADVGRALRHSTDRDLSLRIDEDLDSRDSGTIRDVNGNTVGTWQVRS